MSAPIVLITGALTGIGRAAAIIFAQEGARIVVSGRRDKEGQDLAAELQKRGAEAIFVRTDVRKDEDVRNLVDQTVKRFGRLDIAVNNAGTEGAPGPVTEQTAESFAATFDTNVLGTLLSMKHELKAMLPRGAGASSTSRRLMEASVGPELRFMSPVNIDLHMYEGRTDVEKGKILGHENLGEVIEVGESVSRVKKGDLVCLPFNISCGYCENCERGYTSACLTVNPGKAGGAYGYAGMGFYEGGQAEFLRVPFADFNCLALPEGAEDHQSDYVMLADIWPTGYVSEG
jgi:D-arabinose 1-dehydrogenase-like Zn-dependent alcohol dehydrogenase